jgi:hypothetical protein
VQKIASKDNAMAYEGDELNFCPPQMFDFSRASAVIVSGDGPNKWGHMLLNTGGVGGMYFQVAGVITRPRYMNQAGYERYLRETGKSELRRIPVFIIRPEDSQLKLEQLLNESWTWGAVVHNCETMVEDIIMAGGGPKIHRGLFSLPTEAGWSAWTCAARDCPTHSQKIHHCANGVWFCNRLTPPCPGHSSYQHICDSGTVWTCHARSCPGHSQKSHQCGSGVWTCKRKQPPCPGHSRPEHNCSETG